MNKCHFCGEEMKSHMIKTSEFYTKVKGVEYKFTFIGTIAIIKTKTGMPIENICPQCLKALMNNAELTSDQKQLKSPIDHLNEFEKEGGMSLEKPVY
jgi:hypothetical protein